MAGLYIHIPFCKKRCLYCDFFSTTLLERRGEYVDALLQEISARKGELNEPVRTVYIGGGTPSTLDTIDVFRIMRTINAPEAEEVTIEVNPGDITPRYLNELRQCGINRLSIGVQSFKDDLLKLLGRRHSAVQAIDAVRMAQQAGFDNISIDLMYALPEQKMSHWIADIELALRLNVQHISCYGLMYEEGTQLTRLRDKGELTPINEDTENEMYDYLCKRLAKAGYHHYEVSNFALPGYEAKHNSSYWNGTPYIGVGAGAHSYLPPVRSWNPDDLSKYMKGVTGYGLQVTGNGIRESESLGERELYNERIMLGLRTDQGIAEKDLALSPAGAVQGWIEQDMLRNTDDGRIVATQKGIHLLNRIIEDLMI